MKIHANLKYSYLMYSLQVETQADTVVADFPENLKDSAFLKDLSLKNMTFSDYGRVYRVIFHAPEHRNLFQTLSFLRFQFNPHTL